MDSAQQPDSRRLCPSPKIQAVRMQSEGPLLILACSECQHSFQSYLPTVASIPLAKINCPQCGMSHAVLPEDFLAWLSVHLPAPDDTLRTQLTEEASRITETWYRLKPFADVLTVKGVNLGEGAERELVSLVVQGLIECSKAEKGN